MLLARGVLGGDTRADLMRRWDEGWRCVFTAVEALQPGDLGKSVVIRGEPHSVLKAINRQLTHYAHHIGQIVFLDTPGIHRPTHRMNVRMATSGYSQEPMTSRDLQSSP